MPLPSRRDLLAAAVGTALVPAEAAGAGPDDAATPTSSAATFHDGFEDGDSHSNPPWQVYRREGTFRADVVARESPDGGDRVLAVSETVGNGTSGFVGWGRALTGWDAAWTLSGLFSTAAVSVDEPWQGHGVPLAVEPRSRDRALSLNLGFRDGDGNVHPFEIGGDLVDEVELSHDPGWREGVWYRYEVRHDGDGRYEGRLWRADDARPGKPQAVSVGRAPPDAPRVAGVSMNGGGNHDFEMHHAFVRWTTDGEVRSASTTPRATPEDGGAGPPPTGPVPTPERAGEEWLAGLAWLAWPGVVAVAGPLVLGTLLAVLDRFDGGDDDA